MAGFRSRIKKKYRDIEKYSKDNNFVEIGLTKMATRQLFVTVLSILGVTLLSMGSAFAVFTMTSKSANYNVIKVGTLNIDFKESENDTITFRGDYPKSDEEGLSSTPYTFTITNTGSIAADYKVKIADDTGMIEMEGCSSNQLDKNYIKYSLDGTSVNILGELSGNDYIIDEGTLEPGESQDYSIRFWLKEGVGNDVLNRHYHGKIVIEAVNEQDKLLDALLSDYTNNDSITTYLEGDTTKMYTFQHDATEQTEALTDYRYIGSNPNNYITFNDETWRIIGVFTVENEKGEKEQRVKIIRDEAVYNNYWGAAVAGYDASSVNKILNGDYYNRINDYTSIGLTDNAKSKIASAKWYLGGFTNDDVSALDYYKAERGTNIYGSQADISWLGKVGLIYPSDYAYTFAFEVDDICYNNIVQCSNTSSWLFTGKEQHMITDAAESIITTRAPAPVAKVYTLRIATEGGIEYSDDKADVRPVVYLKSDIKYIGGTGSSSDPFILS